MPADQKLTNIDEHGNATEAVTIEPPPFWLRTVKRAANAFQAHADFFVMLLLLALLTRYCLSLRSPIPIGHIDFFDTAWAVDLIANAHQGVWLGRDAIFTYGPLFQKLLSWVPLRWGISLASFYRSLWIFQYWTIILGIYGTGALLLRKQPSWLRVFYLLVLVTFWVPINWILFDVKLLLPLCWFAAFLRMLPVSSCKLRNLCWRAAAAAILLAVAFLISGDAGVYAAAAFVIIVGSSLLYEHDRASLAGMTKYVALTAALFSALMFTVNGVLGKVLDFRFWRATYEVVTQYRWSQAVRMLPEMVPILWLAVTLNLLVFLWHWIVQSRMPLVPTRSRATCLAMLGFALVCLQTLLVSSEHFHVAIGLFPWIALSTALLLGATEIKVSALRFTLSLAFILIVTGVFSGPYPLFASPDLFRGQSALASSHICPPGQYEIDETCLELADFSKLKTVSDFLTQHTAASDSIGVFPYQNIYGFVARRRVAGAVLQHHVIAGDYLARTQIESLQQARPPWVIYSAERWQSFPSMAYPTSPALLLSGFIGSGGTNTNQMRNLG